ncbi:MAG: phage virion morphogenesis protein [Victivallaceae bacterium]|nr:phage virion morphogenesis protein [Victivallaceae bacterium]
MTKPMFSASAGGFREARDLLRLLEMTPALKRRFLARLGRMAIAQAKKNIKDQKTVDGSAFAPRSAKSSKKGPMLRHLADGKWIKVFMRGDDAAEVGFLRNVGYVANKHQTGSDEQYKLNKHLDLFPRSLWYHLVTEPQAHELIRCGLKLPKSEILKTVTVGDAVNWLRAHKDSWTIRVPARPFLGAGREQRKIWADTLMGDIRERFRAKNYANLLT